MNKSTLIKSAVALVLAIPAVPLLATTSLKKPVAAHVVKPALASAKHHKPHHVVARKVTPAKGAHIASVKTAKKPTSLATAAKKPVHPTVASSVKPHVSSTKSTPAPDFSSGGRVKITHTPPMIDGAHI